MKNFRSHWCGCLSVMLGAVLVCLAVLGSPASANAQAATGATNVSLRVWLMSDCLALPAHRGHA